jgi:ABC-type multidrug transport system ATPase subunit
LDPLGIISLKKLILSLASKEQIAIIISSHIVEHLFKICDTLFVIKKGVISIYEPTNKTKYAITANNIKESKILCSYKTTFEDDKVIVHIEKEKLSGLLKTLLQEKIEITACIPLVDMEALFDKPVL